MKSFSETRFWGGCTEIALQYVEIVSKIQGRVRSIDPIRGD